jgi:hypothetical protein
MHLTPRTTECDVEADETNRLEPSCVRGSCCPCPRCCRRTRERPPEIESENLNGPGGANGPDRTQSWGVLRFKGRIYIRHIRQVTDTSTARELPTPVVLCTSRPVVHLHHSAMRMMASLKR